ncbi:MAG TPA: hypothetical protein VIM73_06645 [Polyangiaceae bacterium]
MKRLAPALALSSLLFAAAAGAQPATAPRSNPHNFNQAPQDESLIAPDLPAGTVEAQVLDAQRNPVASTRVRLGIMFQKISEGESRSERLGTTDGAGLVRFTGLQASSEYSYRITVKDGVAEYGSAPFNLGQQSGHRVKLHVFPVTRDVQTAPVAFRSIIYIEPRDDVFQFEAMFRVYNVGTVTWVPDNVVLQLPSGFKAFSGPKEMGGAGFTQVEGVGARLEGTFSPGQYDVRFRFQIPRDGEESVSFRLAMPPRLADAKVIAEASSQMSLGVEGFEASMADSTQQGKRVLVTARTFNRADAATSLLIDIGGLPVPGPGRWIAVLIASALGLTGFAAYRGLIQLESGDVSRRDRDLERARELLLAEIVEVERSHRNGDLGPRAYADARRVLLESLARLGKDALQPKKRRAVAS